MKKMIAVLMAMVMAFSCMSALAEEAAAPEAVQLPSMTVTSEITVDEEQVMALLSTLGMPEETAGMVKMFLPLLNGLGGNLVFDGTGAQLDLLMKGQEVLSVVGELTENGLALGSNLVPSYVLTIQKETIKQLLDQFTAQFQQAAGQLDMEMLQKAAEKFIGYAMEMSSVYQNLVTFSEPVKGEYPDLIEGVVFNSESALNVDVEGIMEAQKQFMTKVFSDETIKAAIESVAALIPGGAFNPDQILNGMAPEVPAEKLPEVSGLVYKITDDEGTQTAPDTLVIVNATAKEGQDQSGNSTTYVYVNGSAVNISVDIPAQEVSLEIYGEMVENGFTANIAVAVPGFDGEIATAFTMLENGMALDAALYLNDAETPIVVCYADFAMEGERTKTAADGEKTELALDPLVNQTEENAGQASETLSALLMDAMGNGLTDVLTNIKTVMPEQGAMLEQIVNSYMTMMMNNGAEEVPAA